jgi:hypothetical protein
MAAKLTRLTHKLAIQMHLVEESCTNCSSRSWQTFGYTLEHPRQESRPASTKMHFSSTPLDVTAYFMISGITLPASFLGSFNDGVI